MAATDITQIKIGTHKVGIVGLQSAVEELAPDFAHESDDTVAAELLKRLSRQNYIPAKVRESYGRAFVREFRKFLGQPYQCRDRFVCVWLLDWATTFQFDDHLRQSSGWLTASIITHAEPEHGVIDMAAAIVANRSADGFGNPIQVGDQTKG